LILIIASLLLSGCSSAPAASPPPASSSQAAVAPPTSSPAAAAKTWSLSLGHWSSAEHPIQTGCYVPFAQALEKRTNGRVKINFFPGGVMGQPTAHYEKLKGGLLDISMFIPAMLSGEMPISEGVGRLPFIGDSEISAAKALQTLYDEKLMDKSWYEDIHLLWISSNLSGSAIFTNKREIAKIDDLKGAKIRGTGETMKMALEAVGASMVVLNGPELEPAMSKGVVDGGLTPYSSAKDYGMVGSVKFIAEIHPALSMGNIGLAMNKKLWDSFPDDIKQAINEEANMKGTVLQANAYKNADVTAKKAFIDSGAKVNTLPAGDVAKWKEGTAGVQAAWIKQMAGKNLGAEAEKAAKRYAELIAQFDKQP
jgi:TRAP-type C4-dicarboxylate transport system substrate-binding protein